MAFKTTILLRWDQCSSKFRKFQLSFIPNQEALVRKFLKSLPNSMLFSIDFSFQFLIYIKIFVIVHHEINSILLQGGRCVVQSISHILHTSRDATALPLPTRPSVSYVRTLKMRVLTIQWVVKMWAPSHQTGNQRHLKISLSDQIKYIHQAKDTCVLPSLDAYKTKRHFILP